MGLEREGSKRLRDIYQSIKETDKQFGRNINQYIDGSGKLLSKVKGGKF